jgi:hypothetical protein
MRRVRLRRLMLFAAAAFVVLIGVYLLAIRPWHLRWGATDEEVDRPMPGDEINAQPSFNGTRAVTVRARPDSTATTGSTTTGYRVPTASYPRIRI